ncbi:MAG: hypothetical protein IH617_21645 [Hydrogenophaga sp.]|nr:hypothetical protein [Hydrogenophaga sp.]
MADDFRIAGGVAIEPVSLADFAAQIRRFTDSFPIQRHWSDSALQQVLADLQYKSDYGALRICVVRARGGATLGCFIYYHRPGATARVLDVLARDVKVMGVFSDWPATTTFYANCAGLR